MKSRAAGKCATPVSKLKDKGSLVATSVVANAALARFALVVTAARRPELPKWLA